MCKLIDIWGMFGKYVDKYTRRRIKWSKRMKFCISEYQLLNIKYEHHENSALINEKDIGHQMGYGYGAWSTPHFHVNDVLSIYILCPINTCPKLSVSAIPVNLEMYTSQAKF